VGMIVGRYEGRCKPQTRWTLLDHVLIETVARFPEFLKLNGFTTKPLLWELGKRYQPCTACGGTDLTYTFSVWPC
jgi:hypothetical protein